MKTETKDSSIFYINIALIVSIVLIFVFMIRSLSVSTSKITVKDVKQKDVPVVSEVPSVPVYDINKVKESQQSDIANKSCSDFAEMYKNCNKTNVGGDMVEAWSRVRPEDKARVMNGFDEQIAISKEKLKIDPKDKHAKNILHVSEMLKKISSDGFNYKLKDKE